MTSSSPIRVGVFSTFVQDEGIDGLAVEGDVSRGAARSRADLEAISDTHDLVDQEFQFRLVGVVDRVRISSR